MSDSSHKLGLQAAWSMAVGGMVGGGIFSTLGVVIGIAGEWAWLSFVVAGLIALMAGYAYSRLADAYGEGGGAFTFLRKIHRDGFAGSLSWVLVVGYVLTNAVYASTFGLYLAHVFELGSWFPRVAAIAIIAIFVVLNLRGTGKAGSAEVFFVWFKMIVLVGLAAFGLARWNPDMLAPSHVDAGPLAAIFGAAAVFMAYEGFQLLAYDYNDLKEPKKTLPRAIMSAITVVIVVYVLVTLGVAMLIGADAVIENREVALAVAGQAALGTTGLVIVTLAAAFSTGSAINSTLFATARLAHLVAKNGELPAMLDHRNSNEVPDRALIALGSGAALLAAFGSLSSLVEAASLTFLFTFSVVCGLAWMKNSGLRVITGAGAITAAMATIALVYRLATETPLALAFLAGLVLLSIFARPWLLRHVRTEDG